MTKIIAFSGRKQAGKNTCGNLIISMCMAELGVIPAGADYWISEDGLIATTNVLGNVASKEDPWIFDPSRDVEAFNEVVEQHMTFHPEDSKPFPYVKLYSFADCLKQDVCIGLLGLTQKQCYGTDADKDSLTKLRWEDMPGVVTKPFEDKYGNTQDDFGFKLHQGGRMTAREVLQYVGTEIFRRMYNNVWADATVRKILKDNPEYAVITDCRFPNEVTAVQEAKGKVIRLTRNSKSKDAHLSETALDRENFDWAKFDAIIDNDNMDIPTQNKAVISTLVGWKWLEIK